MPVATHYDNLHIQPDATTAAVKKAYFFLARQHHPDKQGNADRFNEIATAYEILSDPVKRAAYDKALLDNQEEDTFDCAETGTMASESQALVPISTFSFKDTVIDARMTPEEFVELAIENASIAQRAFTDPVCINIISGMSYPLHLKRIAMHHEKLAQVLLLNKKYWSLLTYDPSLIFDLAEKFASVAKLLFANKELLDNQPTEAIIKLQNIHHEKINLPAPEKTNIKNRIRAYQQLQPYLSTDTGVPATVISIDTLLDLLQKAKLTIKDLVTLAKNHAFIASACVTRAELRHSLQKNSELNLYWIGCEHEEVALAIINDQKIWEKLTYNPELLYQLANKHPSVCAILVANNTITRTLETKQLYELMELMRQPFAVSLQYNTQELNRLNAYVTLKPYTVTHPAPPAIDADEVIKLVRTAMISREAYTSIARQNSCFAEALLTKAALVAWLQSGTYAIDIYRIASNHPKVALYVLKNEKIIADMIKIPAWIIALAALSKETAETALASPNILAIFSSKALFELTVKYGIYIADIEAQKRLQAYVLLKKASQQKDGLTIRKKPVTQIKRSDVEENLYQMGLAYEKKASAAAHEVANEYFYQAACLGHRLALEKLMTNSDNILISFRIAQICSNPDFATYDQQEVIKRVGYIIERASEQDISHLLAYMTKQMTNFSDEDYQDKIGELYLSLLVGLEDKHAKSALQNVDEVYRTMAKALANLDPAHALCFMKRIPGNKLTLADLIEMPNIASNAIWNSQLEEVLATLALPHTDEKLHAALNEPHKVATRIMYALPYWFKASALDNSKATSELIKHILNQLVALPLHKAGLARILPDAAMQRTAPYTLVEELILILCENQTQILKDQSLTDLIMPHIQHPEVLFRLGMYSAIQADNEVTKTTRMLWQTAAKLQKSQGEHRIIGLLTVIDSVAQILSKYSTAYALLFESTKLIIEKNHYHYTRTLIRLNQLPTCYEQFRQQFVKILSSDSIDAKKMHSFKGSIRKAEKAQQALLGLKALADTLPPQYDTIRNQIAAMDKKALFDDILIRRSTKKIDELQKFAEKTSAQKAAMVSVLVPLQQLTQAAPQNKKQQIQLEIVQKLQQTLDKNIRAHFSQDFSDPEVVDHATFKATCIGLIKKQLEHPKVQLQKEAGLLKRVVAWLVRQLRRIFPESPRISEWVKSSSAHFKVAPVEGKKMRKQVEVVFR